MEIQASDLILDDFSYFLPPFLPLVSFSYLYFLFLIAGQRIQRKAIDEQKKKKVKEKEIMVRKKEEEKSQFEEDAADAIIKERKNNYLNASAAASSSNWLSIFFGF